MLSVMALSPDNPDVLGGKIAKPLMDGPLAAFRLIHSCIGPLDVTSVHNVDNFTFIISCNDLWGVIWG